MNGLDAEGSAEPGPASSPSSSAAPGDGSDDTVWCVDTRLPIHVGRCLFEVPEAPEGQAVDTDSLVLRIAGYNGDAVLDLPMQRVPDAQACTTTQAEWYYRQDAEPPLLVLCPNGCPEQGGQALLWVRAECL